MSGHAARVSIAVGCCILVFLSFLAPSDGARAFGWAMTLLFALYFIELQFERIAGRRS